MIDRTGVRLQKENESKIRRIAEQKALNSDYIEKAKICRKFVNDKRHAEFKALFDDALFNLKFKQLLDLPKTAKDNDEYLRRSISLISEMSLIKYIFSTPEMFFQTESKIKENEK